ncbi:aminoglycoside phosphotransferase family protein [Micromonospora zhanjiangensis]|uniref:Aminoglycoside phosphotransferase family protein n=1 Tax=Micromonospora zhanjiangensis TaxID=1522057 RepID=A0ABV8KQF0_9ACTN
MPDDEVLQDEPHREIVRVGDSVRRPVQPWSATVHALLRHLEAVGFPYAPRVLGIDGEGREVLTYLDGESGPAGWAKVVDDDGLVAMARLLRDYHEAVAGFRPSAGAFWAGRTEPPGAGEVVCHGDFGPWNLVWRGTRPVGILDWDYAWPARPVHDVAYALEYVAPFRADDECVRWLRYPAPPDRRRRLERFAEAYGLTSTAGLVDEVIDQQQLVLERTRQLAAEGCEPQVSWQASGALDRIAERVRWSRAHRHLFS